VDYEEEIHSYLWRIIFFDSGISIRRRIKLIFYIRDKDWPAKISAKSTWSV
jgi:hypothetical protein